MCLAQGHNTVMPIRLEPSVSSQALYHCAPKIVDLPGPITRRVGGNRKRYQRSTNADQKSIETVFLIVICRQCGDKWPSKTMFLTIFYLRSSILAFSIVAYLDLQAYLFSVLVLLSSVTGTA